jgi:hypothetical protein
MSFPVPYAAPAAAAAAAAEEVHPWEREGWVPTTASGKQKSPNVIRGELQRFIDASPLTQTAIIEKMGVNNNTFRRFMDPKTYKNQWSAVNNGTYWAAARLLAEDKWEKQQAKKKGGGGGAAKKRKAAAPPADGAENVGNAGGGAAAAAAKPSAKKTKADAVALMAKINATQADTSIVYDSCPEVVKKVCVAVDCAVPLDTLISSLLTARCYSVCFLPPLFFLDQIKAFLDEPGVTKADFLTALGGINHNSLRTFLMGKKQDQCGNVTYKRAYSFFEKKRILEGKKKTARRIKNEAEHPHGFSLEKERGGKWVFAAAGGGWGW